MNAHDFGTRGSYVTPEHRIGRGRIRGWSGRWRSDAYNAAYGRDFKDDGRRGLPSFYRRGRRTEYGTDLTALGAGRGTPGPRSTSRGAGGPVSPSRSPYLPPGVVGPESTR